MRIVDLPPLASSLTESIRDIGNSLNTAMADIIDEFTELKKAPMPLYFQGVF